MCFIKELRFDILNKDECPEILKSEYEDVVCIPARSVDNMILNY
jgi:hypothetical protein